MITRTGYSLKPVENTAMNKQQFFQISSSPDAFTSSQNAFTNSPLSIGRSFEKMGFGKIGGLGGRMGELEKASLRLAQFKGTQSKEEQERDIAAKRMAQERDIAARAAEQERERRSINGMGNATLSYR